MATANLPDLDVLVFATEVPGIAFRRGWTHGVLAQVLLPLAFTATVVLVDRLRRRRRAADPVAPPLRVRWLIALSYAGVLSHVALDYLNNYGIRLLAPFDWNWFYGDAVFIVDVWLWVMLGSGVWLARRSGRSSPARGALAFAACYVVLMLLSARAARDVVADTWRNTLGEAPQRLMVGPLPVTPLSREIIVDRGDRYETGTLSWAPLAVTVHPETVAKNDRAPEVLRARGSPDIAAFLTWSRFPYWNVEQVSGGTRVTVRDMRFGGRFAASTVIPAHSPE